MLVRSTTQDLKWDPSSNVYKAIFIAGNEAFTQGPINANDSVKSAIAAGVIVNTIHCGSEQAGISGGWKNGAMLADGKFLTIDHNRAVAKGSLNYCNTSWDLVDASKDKKFDITQVKQKDLPKEMQKMTADECKAHVAKKAKTRSGIQMQILELNKKRNTYVAEKRKEMAKEEGKTTLDEVVASTVRAQAEKKGYKFTK